MYVTTNSLYLQLTLLMVGCAVIPLKSKTREYTSRCISILKIGKSLQIPTNQRFSGVLFNSLDTMTRAQRFSSIHRCFAVLSVVF